MKLINLGTGDIISSFAINFPETLMLVENNNIYFKKKCLSIYADSKALFYQVIRLLCVGSRLLSNGINRMLSLCAKVTISISMNVAPSNCS